MARSFFYTVISTLARLGTESACFRLICSQYCTQRYWRMWIICEHSALYDGHYTIIKSHFVFNWVFHQIVCKKINSIHRNAEMRQQYKRAENFERLTTIQRCGCYNHCFLIVGFLHELLRKSTTDQSTRQAFQN